MRVRTRDPKLTLAWLDTPPIPAAPKRFTENRGRVRYSQWKQSSKTPSRLAYLVGATCEIDSCGASEPAAVLVFDHCHHHGWIRAVLCNAHNVRIAHLEAAWREHGVDLTGTPYWAVLMGCRDCQVLVDTMD